jgi:cytochrome c biogenesis protein CcdA
VRTIPLHPSPEPPGDPFPYVLLVACIVAAALGGYTLYQAYPRFDLPPAEGAALLALGVAAGIASFFSPCAFPLLVALLGREAAATPAARLAADGDARPLRRAAGVRPLTFAAAVSAGAVLFLIVTGAALGAGGGLLLSQVTFTSVAGRALRGGVGALLIALGLVQLGLVANPLRLVGRLATPLVRASSARRERQPVGRLVAFGFGYVLAGFG